MNQMMVSTIYANGAWFTVEGEGYRKTGAITRRRRACRCRTSPGWRSAWSWTATPRSATTGRVVGDPTEAALVVLSAKLGVDAEETRRAYPRIAEVPFDSEYKFMATFHHVPPRRRRAGHRAGQGRARRGAGPLHASPGGPLSGAQVPIDKASADIDAANARMGEKGLRVLAFAARSIEDTTKPTMTDDPMTLTQDLGFVGMVGIIDPLRAEAKGAVPPRWRPGSTYG